MLNGKTSVNGGHGEGGGSFRAVNGGPGVGGSNGTRDDRTDDARSEPKLSDRLKAFNKRTEAGTANVGDTLGLLTAIINEALKPPRQGRVGSDLTAERSEVVNALTKDITTAIASRLVDHGPDNERACQLIISTAMLLAVTDINNQMFPGFRTKFAESAVLSSLLAI